MSVSLYPRWLLSSKSLPFVFLTICLLTSDLQKNAFGHMPLSGIIPFTHLPLRSKIPAFKHIRHGKDRTTHATLEKEGTQFAFISFANYEAANASSILAQAYTSSTIEVNTKEVTHLYPSSPLVRTVMADTTVSAFSVHGKRGSIKTEHLKRSDSMTHCTKDSPAVGGDSLLINDCNTLLHARVILDPGGTLHWYENESMARWNGVKTAQGRVTELDLRDGNIKLQGSIPAELGNLDSLTILDLGGGGQNPNELTGSIPEELGNLTKLTTLNLAVNQLTGPIPAELGNLTNLERLYLNNNRSGSSGLTGPIPAELGNLTKLTRLYLDNNALEGEIPAELGNLDSLEILRLHTNKLKGNIPTQLGNLTNLLGLYLGDNNFTGNIPTELGNLDSLEILWLHENALEGEIPTELGNLTNLRRLFLDENNLTGSIPPQLGNLENLTALWLKHNRLTGCVPSVLDEFFDDINPQQEEVILPECEKNIVLSEEIVDLTTGSATYTVVLEDSPSDTVKVIITGGVDDVTVVPDTLDFTLANWYTPQAVTLSATLPAFSPFTLTHIDQNEEYATASLEVIQRVSTEGMSDLPEEFALQGNYPNPFNPSTRIVFDLPQRAVVHVEINDLLGRRVKTPMRRDLDAGLHTTITVDMSDLVSGTYLYRLIARYGNEKHVQYGRMMLIK